MNIFKVTAELNMCAEKVESVYVKANTENKAVKFAKELFAKHGAFHVNLISVEKVKEYRRAE